MDESHQQYRLFYTLTSISDYAKPEANAFKPTFSDRESCHVSQFTVISGIGMELMWVYAAGFMDVDAADPEQGNPCIPFVHVYLDHGRPIFAELWFLRCTVQSLHNLSGFCVS